MEKVVFITGASTGIGNATAKLFQTKNWKVAATMRSPEEAQDLVNIADVEVLRLDVTDIESIRSAIAETIDKFGRIDAVVNNAGFSVAGPFEATTTDQIERQFRTNVFGMMNVCREILPYFREQRRGTIINIASVGGRITFPYYSLYNATKWAVEGFSESLQYELEPFKVRVKIIEPGPIKTDFYNRSQELVKRSDLTAYENSADRALANMRKAGESAPDGSAVAQVIYDAATDASGRLRYAVNAKGLLAMRRLLPDAIFSRIIKMAILR